MITIPYVGGDNNACALACHTMIAKYFFPETTFEQIAKLSDWEPGYVVWAFKFWNWIMHKGTRVTDYDLIEYHDWAAHGAGILQTTMPQKEFDFINSHTKDPNVLTDELRELIRNQQFVYHKRKPTFEDLRGAIQDGKPCEVVLDSHALDKIGGFALHRVVVVDVDDQFVTFHDPRPQPRANRKETIEQFKTAWLDALSAPELCIYSST